MNSSYPYEVTDLQIETTPASSEPLYVIHNVITGQMMNRTYTSKASAVRAAYRQFKRVYLK